MSPPQRDPLLHLLHQQASSYSEAKTLAAELDIILGYQITELEKKIEHEFVLQENSPQVWSGLDIQSLQTPYHEFVEMIQALGPKQHETWIDLGAAYGRCGIVLGCLCPEVRFLGYEIVPSRVSEGNRIYADWEFTHAKLFCQDIAENDFELPSADVYFAYDFGSKKHIDDVFQKLALKARQPQAKKFKIIGRGRGLRHWIPMRYPWLQRVADFSGEQNWFVYEAF